MVGYLDATYYYISIYGDQLDDEEDDPFCEMEAGANPVLMYSGDLVTYIGYLESENIFVLFGSCFSGGFVKNLEGTGRFIITSTDQYNYANAYNYSIPNDEPYFEHYFFSRISQGYGDYSSYTYAVTQTQNEYPDQEPMYDDEIAYTWFEWW